MPSLFRRGGFAILAFLVPVFAALYFLTIPNGTWPAIAGAQAVAGIAFGLAAVSYYRVSVWVEPDAVTERGFFGRVTRLPLSDIGSVLLVHTFYGGGVDTVPQLFICDRNGAQVIRLRGQFWSSGDMDAVCDRLGVPLTELPEPLTTRELLEQYPGLFYWFERHPVLAGCVLAVSMLVAGGLLYAGLAAIGIT